MVIIKKARNTVFTATINRGRGGQNLKKIDLTGNGVGSYVRKKQNQKGNKGKNKAVMNLPTKSNNIGGRGGARAGAGRKKTALSEKVKNGNDGRKVEVLDIPDIEGVEMPKPHDFLSAEQRDGSELQASEIYTETWNWLKKIGCASKVSPQLLERYAMCSARWIQCEEMTNKLGFTVNDNEGVDEMSKVINACVKITGSSPTELQTMSEKEPTEEECEIEEMGLTISLPIQKANAENLKAILDSKSSLIKHALGVDDLAFETEEDKISFPWFSSRLDPEIIETYTRFISALCEMSVKQSRVQAKEKKLDNEKYTFRCFLLRLGFIGEKFKKDRKILLKNLVGSASYNTNS